MRKVLIIFCSVMFLEAVIGISQYVLQESLGLRFFGEPVINSHILGVAKVDFMNMKFLRSYGTFSHPNIFAGYLVFAIFSIMYLFRSFPKMSSFFVLVFLIALFLTFSRTGLIAFVIGAFVFSLFVVKKLNRWKLLKISLLILGVAMLFLFLIKGFPLFIERINSIDAESLRYRVMYLVIGFAMFFQNPFGVGVGNFTDVMQNFSILKLFPWEIQPVHNIFVLSLAELGMIGFAALVSLFVYLFVYSFKKKNPFFIAICFMLLVLGSFDHYLFTLYQGQALFWLSICALYPFKNSLSDIEFLPSI
ncbi:MAG: O-antigen ligase family protein [Candidatus Peregrinibacteria bacterium]|nr:O-antigen ligase family protein [Candidatus Peregrinibacteria bacterium]